MLKRHLLLNHLLDFDKTWLGMILIWPSSVILLVLVDCITSSNKLKKDFQNENFKSLLIWNYKAKSHDIWYVASPSGLLQSLFKLWPWGPWGHMFYICLYRENIYYIKKNILTETTRLDIWYVALPIVPLPSLFKHANPAVGSVPLLFSA